MKNQALFSSKDKSKTIKCRLLQFLFGALRVNVHIDKVSVMSRHRLRVCRLFNPTEDKRHTGSATATCNSVTEVESPSISQAPMGAQRCGCAGKSVCQYFHHLSAHKLLNSLSSRDETT